MGSGRKYWATPTEENNSKKDDRSSTHAPVRDQISPKNFHLERRVRGCFLVNLIGVQSPELPEPRDGVVFRTTPSERKMTQISPNRRRRNLTR